MGGWGGIDSLPQSVKKGKEGPSLDGEEASVFEETGVWGRGEGLLLPQVSAVSAVGLKCSRRLGEDVH